MACFKKVRKMPAFGKPTTPPVRQVTPFGKFEEPKMRKPKIHKRF